MKTIKAKDVIVGRTYRLLDNKRYNSDFDEYKPIICIAMRHGCPIFRNADNTENDYIHISDNIPRGVDYIAFNAILEEIEDETNSE